MFSSCFRKTPSENVDGSWSKVLDLASRSVVLLRTNQVRSFAGEGPISTIATGFIVDKARGILLTNRHVVTVTGDCIFLSQEEAPVRPIYRDPIHDFGFFSFDPSLIKYQELEEIPLHPEECKIGTEIRIVGNDAGERLQILSGVISRLDRETPEYGGSYEDFDTFYVASASSTSGGSSGSPVLNIKGQCIALNSGAAVLASSSFFLPLESIVRALNNIVNQKFRPSRGTLEATFKYMPMTEARKFGLSLKDEADIRSIKPMNNGVMVVDKLIPKGKGFNAGLKEGDLLLKIGNENISNFSTLETILDMASDDPNKSVELVVHRGGGEKKCINVLVKSLWETFIDEFLEFSGGIFHAIPYQYCIWYGLNQNDGVFVADPGYSFGRAGVEMNCVLTKIGEKTLTNLADLVEALSQHADEARVSFRYFNIDRKHQETSDLLIVDRHWFLMNLVKRTVGESWKFYPCPPPPSIERGRPLALSASSSESAGEEISSKDLGGIKPLHHQLEVDSKTETIAIKKKKKKRLHIGKKT